ncbi:MAG: hypothetical protein AAF598_03255 [Bacteroidota bacterium]
MIKKNKFDLLDDEFILHLQENELDPLELPDSEQSAKDQIEEIVEDGEKMWWIGLPNTEAARKTIQGVDFDSDTWVLIRLTILIPLLFLVFLPGGFSFLLLTFWVIVIFYFKSIVGVFFTAPLHKNVRYYISNQDIQFIYPNLNESYEVNWEHVMKINLVETPNGKEIHFTTIGQKAFRTYDFYSEKVYNEPVIQSIKKVDRIYERILAFHKRWQTEQLLKNEKSH